MTMLRACTLILTLAATLGCQPSDAGQQTGQGALDPPPRKPTGDQLLQAAHSGYRTSPGTRQECIGRQVFDVPHEIEWEVKGPRSGEGLIRNAPTDKDDFSNVFPDGLYHLTSRLHYERWNLGVMAPVSREEFDRWRAGEKDWYPKLIRMREESIAKTKAEIAEYRKKIDGMGREGHEELVLSALEDDIERLTKDIAVFRSRIAAKFLFDSEDVFGVQEAGYYAFLFKNQRAYRIQMFGPRDQGAETPEQFDQRFADFVRRFRPRAMYEIPTEPGVCIPYGFIPDDGTGDYQVKVAFRFKDHPGVAYDFNTGLAYDARLRNSPGNHYVSNLPEPSMFRATTLGLTGLLGGGAVAGRMEKSIGPRTAKIGAIDASQGGFSIITGEADGPKVPSYTIYTATNGFPDVHILPFIVLEVSSYTRKQFPTLPEDPPPFDETMARVDTLLKSIRLRPTSPPMPELKALK